MPIYKGSELMKKAAVLLSQLAFPESLRWHNGVLWFSDMFGSRSVNTLDSNGTLHKITVVPKHPSGIAFGLDGCPLVISMNDCCIFRILDGSGTLETFCDFSALAVHGNDMTMAPDGTLYVGDVGFLFGEEDPVLSNILKVTTSGVPTVAAEGVALPNGMLVTPDGNSLIVAETLAGRLSEYAIDADGDLGERRTFCSFDNLGWEPDLHVLMQRPVAPDGICLDAKGSIWIGNPLQPIINCVNSNGDVVDTVELSQPGIDCALGGPDGHTLFVGTGSIVEQESGLGKIETCRVDTPAS